MSITSPATADRLADVRGRARELRERRTQVQKLHHDAKEAAAAYSGPDIQTSEEFMRLQRVSGDLDEIRNALDLVEAEEKYVLSARAGLNGPIQRDNFMQDPAKLEELHIRAQSGEPIDILLGTVKGRDEIVAELRERQRRFFAAAGDVVLPSDASRTSTYGILPPLLRTLRVANLIPATTMDGGAFEILVEA